MKRIFFAVVFLLSLVIFTPVINAEATPLISISPTASPAFSTPEATPQPLTPTGNQDSVQIKDVYEALLKTKDDKIAFTSNFVNWLLAITAIIITVFVAVFGWTVAKVRTQSNKTKELIETLEKKEKEITDIQTNIDQYLKSESFINRLRAIEEIVNKLDNKVTEWEREDTEEQINGSKRTIADNMHWFNKFKMIERVKDKTDIHLYQTINDINEAIKRGELVNLSLKEWKEYQKLASYLVNSYYRPEDKFV